MPVCMQARMSDVMQECGFLDHVPPGFSLVADKGFLMREALMRIARAELIVPVSP